MRQFDIGHSKNVEFEIYRKFQSLCLHGIALQGFSIQNNCRSHSNSRSLSKNGIFSYKIRLKIEFFTKESLHKASGIAVDLKLMTTGSLFFDFEQSDCLEVDNFRVYFSHFSAIIMLIVQNLC